MPASIPEVTGIGGNTFNDSAGGYWSHCERGEQRSAMKYIPETPGTIPVSPGIWRPPEAELVRSIRSQGGRPDSAYPVTGRAMSLTSH